MKKTFIAISIILIVIAILAIPNTIFAATLDSSNSTVTINRYVNNVNQDVNATFQYEITAKEGNPANVTIPNATVTFENVEPGSDYVAAEEASIDLSSIDFPVLGDYAFEIKEVDSSESELYPVDSTNSYTLHVSVRNAVDASGTPTGEYVVTKYLTENVGNTKVVGSEIDFESDAKKTTISLKKVVSGDLADTEKYFTFEVFIQGPDAVYDVEGGSHVDNPTQISSSTATTVYLKNGETLTIGSEQIMPGGLYSFEEIDGQDYTTTINYADGTKEENSKDTNSLNADADPANNLVTFDNNKESEVETGVLFSVAPYALIVVVAIALIFVFKKISRQYNEE